MRVQRDRPRPRPRFLAPHEPGPLHRPRGPHRHCRTRLRRLHPPGAAASTPALLAPTLLQNRATIAGMVANNACGPHATAWGRTSDNIVALDCVDGRGRRFTATTGRDSALRDVPGLATLIDSHLAPIRTQLGRFKRQVSGYSLEHLTPEGGRNLAAMLTGTEGTLVLILSVTVRLVPLPDAPVLAALGYHSMIEAADDVPALLAHSPLAVEGMDRRLVDVVRAHKGPGAVPALPEGEGWLLVEVGAPGEHVTASLERARALCAASAAVDTVVYPPGTQASALWRIRADGAGLGGRTPPDGAGGGDQQALARFRRRSSPAREPRRVPARLHRPHGGVRHRRPPIRALR